jgi:hypothetical protein
MLSGTPAHTHIHIFTGMHIHRVLKGSNVERDMVLHMSGRMVELPWGATLLHTLREQGIEYKVCGCM